MNKKDIKTKTNLEKTKLKIEWHNAIIYRFEIYNQNAIYILCKDRESLSYFEEEYEWDYNWICISEDEIFREVEKKLQTFLDIDPQPKYNIWDIIYWKNFILKVDCIEYCYAEYVYCGWGLRVYENKIFGKK